MSEYRIDGRSVSLWGDPSINRYEISVGGEVWCMSDVPFIVFADETKIPFGAPVSEKYVKTGTGEGIAAVYSGFEGHKHITVHTTAMIETLTDDVYFTMRVEGDRDNEINFVSFPAPFDFGKPFGDCAELTEKNLPRSYTVLPLMQGSLIPAGTKVDKIKMTRMNTYTSSMSMFGQVRGKTGYLAIFETSYDGLYELRYENGEKVAPLWGRQLERMNYPRRMLYRFMTGCDYNDFAASYREYIRSRGWLVTLKEKIARNPNIARLIGCPIIHEEIAVHIQKDSNRYHPNDPYANDHFTPFSVRAEQLHELHSKGVKKAYTHFDGWCRRGYDNQHPDVFPPNEEAGGAEGMRALSDTTIELGYIFGVHDQYRDYYLDADSFDPDNTLLRADGTYPIKLYWDGGKHTYLCPSLARDYVRRNYNTFEQMGIRIEGAYLDVFAIAEMDQCFHPAHRVTREQCAAYRRECLEIINAKGIIPSSEDVLDCILPSMCLCHHAPHITDGECGIPIPLFNLVYHDCVVSPWRGRKGAAASKLQHIKTSESYARAWLNAGVPYLSITADEAEIVEVEQTCRMAEKLAFARMLRHEFASADGMIQRTVFEDGTVIEVNFETDEVCMK